MPRSENDEELVATDNKTDSPKNTQRIVHTSVSKQPTKDRPSNNVAVQVTYSTIKRRSQRSRTSLLASPPSDAKDPDSPALANYNPHIERRKCPPSGRNLQPPLATSRAAKPLLLSTVRLPNSQNFFNTQMGHKM